MSLHTAIQTAILDAIKEPGFNAALPPLSDQKWAEILHTYPSAKEENERLEFVGDALMYATLGRQLYTQIPVGSAHLYTTIRGALHSNVTFSCLAEKLDILAVSDTIMRALTRRKFGEGIFEASKIKRTAKPIADLFEVIIAAYYFERGFEPLNAWVNELYRPLIDIAHRAFIQYRTHPSSNKMKRKLAVTASVPASKKPKLMSTSSGDHVLPKRQVLPLPRHMLTDPRARVSPRRTVKTPRAPLWDRLATPAAPKILATVSSFRSQADIIDLTGEDEDSDPDTTIQGSDAIGKAERSLPLPRTRFHKQFTSPIVIDDSSGSESDGDDDEVERQLQTGIRNQSVHNDEQQIIRTP
ncbi:hypothetical protein ABKN59_001923 [Abortiporus biennis]